VNLEVAERLRLLAADRKPTVRCKTLNQRPKLLSDRRRKSDCGHVQVNRRAGTDAAEQEDACPRVRLNAGLGLCSLNIIRMLCQLLAFTLALQLNLA
jgi:hypothetical protein